MGTEHIHIIPTAEWLNTDSKPLIIAGPCSAESESQIMHVAEGLSKSGRVHLMRAGIWKPRTRPNTFEGMGVQALPWLRKAQEQFGVKWMVEVANEEHVKAALDEGIEIVWIGARTTVNPFSVQEIANALEGNDIPVFIKNPLNPDLELWIGAFERFSKVGLHKLVGVHRGFNTYQDHVFRNSPNWEIPIELKTKLPQLEIVVDPSHIAGKRNLLHEISQKALDLAFDGLMIEVHPNPDAALSDPKQQIALDDFTSFLNELENRKTHFVDAVSIDKLQRLRSLIDEIDYNLLENLKRRIDIVDEIGLYKAESGVTVFQLERWIQIIEDRLQYAKEQGIDAALVKDMWTLIHNASIKRQTEIVNKNLSERDTFDA